MLAVCSPFVTASGNMFVSARSLARTPVLSRSACSDGVWTSLSRPSQKADTLVVMASCEVWTAPGVCTVESDSCTRPWGVGRSAACTLHVAGSLRKRCPVYGAVKASGAGG